MPRPLKIEYPGAICPANAGADGLILSRKYSEMRLVNLTAAGKAARAFGK